MSFENLTAYEVLEEHYIADIKSTGTLLRHKKSGARVALLSNDDDNKVFNIGFRTAPKDETGVPHIIEHTVLCGSDKYPLKDPFVELVKGSLNTFLNAMTYPDKTIFPVASCNLQDFKNLMDVYMDAVFHPNITKYEEIFKQEGWHYELEDENAPIIINGVVYNEMKGAYSSPEEVLQNWIYKSLFPDNTYSKDSGGNPVHIPELTYEKYLEFYRSLYHPANSYIYLYGDMDMEERLRYMDEEYLGKYDYLEVDSAIPPQKGFDTLAEVEETYSIASDDPEENATYLSYNRVIGNALDKELGLAFDVIDYALVSAPGAPIRQALIDAGIGEDVYGSYDNSTCQPVFSIIAKNANAKDKDRFLAIIDEELRKVVKNGFDKDSLMASLNSSEFRFREADFGSFPKGLFYVIYGLSTWLFDDMQPFTQLECLSTFAYLKEQTKTDYFEKLVEKYLLNNTHGSTVVIKPEREKNKAEEEALAKQLEAYKASLSPEQIAKLIADTKALKLYQETPTSDEDLRKLPLLSRKDIRKEILPMSNQACAIDDIRVMLHDIETNGIDYFTLMFDADDVKVEELGYLEFLAIFLGYIDTADYGYARLNDAVNIYTGGISPSIGLYHNVQNPEEFRVKFEWKVKVLEEHLDKALDLLDQMLYSSDLDGTKRLAELITQTKARMQMSLSSAGNVVSSMRALRSVSKYAFYKDATSGISFYRTVVDAERMIAEDPITFTEHLKNLCKKLFVRERLTISFTATEAMYKQAQPKLEAHLQKLPSGTTVGPVPQIRLEGKKEGFADASQIQYVSRAGNFRNHGFEYTGVLRILRVIMSYDYLWINVRVKGGAYGCGGSFLRTGEVYFSSYRDPNLEKTNEIYDGVPEYLRNFNPDERDMTKYIIGTFGSLDTPMNPEAKGDRSMSLFLAGITEEMLQKERDQILGASVADIQALAPMMEAALSDNLFCVIGNENSIKAAEGMFDSVEKLFV